MTTAPDNSSRAWASNSPSCFWKFLKREEKRGWGGGCDPCTWKAPMCRSPCRWLLCLWQQLFQGLGAPSKTTTPPNSCPLSELCPAWQEAGGRWRQAPPGPARPRGCLPQAAQLDTCGKVCDGQGPQNLLWRPTETLGNSQTCCVSSLSPAVNNQLQGGHNFLKQAFPRNEKGLLKEEEKSWWVTLSKIESQQTWSKVRQMM